MSRKVTIQEMQELAARKGGKCLSTQYINAKTKLLWECAAGHSWEAQPGHIKNSGSWCPECAGLKRLTLENMQQLAASKGGKCLSPEYKGMMKHLEWECAAGHSWTAVPNEIKNGNTWCPVCAGKKMKTIEEMQQLAKSNGGKCLSSQYTNNRTKLLWECAAGHSWQAVPDSVTKGSWCPTCAGILRLDIESAKALAESRGGKCLSTQYQDNRTYLEWQCFEGHKWKASYNSVQRGNWCPYCNKYVNQEKCRYILDKLLNKPFEITRTVLEGYELDGYNKELNLAFEYHGEQHYHFIKLFHRTNERFIERQQADQEKERLCQDKGIKLIVIPYTQKDNLLQYLTGELEKHGFKVNTNLDQFNYKDFIVSISYLKKARELAENKGGKCLSNQYLGYDKSMEWECAAGHSWKTSYHHIKDGSWCPKCANINKIGNKYAARK